MNTTEQTVEWRWHRQDEKHKSHLMAELYSWTLVAACSDYDVYGLKEANGDMSAPCRNCLRASAGLKVGRG